MGSRWAEVAELWKHMLCKLLCACGDLAAGADWTSGFCDGTRGQCLACYPVSGTSFFRYAAVSVVCPATGVEGYLGGKSDASAWHARCRFRNM